MTEKAVKPAGRTKRAERHAAPERYIRITLAKSLIGYPSSQRTVARGLGLRKPQSHVVHRESPEILGMVRKISHVLKVEAVEKP
jgi:large subunit ribosomal protein L30